jgi:hypothetical protein
VLWTISSLIIFLQTIFFNYMIKIYAYKIEHQPKNRHLFEIVITLWKTIKNKSCSLFPSQFNIKGPKIKKKSYSFSG